MVQEIMHDPLFLSLKAETAQPQDLSVAQDLLETLVAHEEECVGMAANMIGVNKRIIAFDDNGTYWVMMNPVIVKKAVNTKPKKGVCRLQESGLPGVTRK